MPERLSVDLETLGERKRLDWIRSRYKTDALTIVPPFHFRDAEQQFTGVGILFVPRHPSDLRHRSGRVDVFLNEFLDGDALDGFIPSFYDFAIGVLSVTWSGCDHLDAARSTCLKATVRGVLEDRLTQHLRAIRGDDAFTSLIASYESQLWRVLGLSKADLSFLGDHMVLESTRGRSTTFNDFFTKRTISEAKARIHVSTRLDPTREPYRTMFSSLFEEVVDAREPGRYQAMKRIAGAEAITVVDTKETLTSPFQEVHDDPDWRGLIEDFHQLPLLAPAQVFVMKAHWPPAVFVPGDDGSEDRLRKHLDAVEAEGASEPHLDYVEYALRAEMRGGDHPSRWTLLLNAANPLTGALKRFPKEGLARLIGVRQIEHLALLAATGSMRTEDQWHEMQGLLARVDTLERHEASLQDQINRLNDEIERRRKELLGKDITIGERSSMIESLESKLDTKTKDLAETQSELAALIHNATGGTAQWETIASPTAALDWILFK